MRHHANRGRKLEAILDVVHRGYISRGAAYVVRTPPPIRVLSTPKRGVFRGCFEGEGPPDYLAVVDGVPVAIDAKECHASRWPLSHLPAHQAAHFDAIERVGGRGAVLLSFPASTWLLPWTHDGEQFGLRQRWQPWASGDAGRGEASIAAHEAYRVGVEVRDWDWLRAWRAAS